jgi:hypothetical protein
MQSLSVLSALGALLERQFGYTRDVHYLRIDGSVRRGRAGASAGQRSEPAGRPRRSS